ncbi:MAG TPA: LysM peptidoglycan-binding domain-containing protein, partial [Nitrospirae bacterium]|nr:LysM peptidoglycan-binding domain-containing protein [Nitrospirota bacterium]
MKKGISVYILFIIMGIIAMGSILYAAQEYIEYIVKKGDTQWDIAEKTLKDPYDWPKVWVVNPEIKNPDLIYPGQRIRIPIRLVKESVKKEALEVKSAGEQKKMAGIGQSGQQEFFTVQIGSFPDMDNSERAYDRAVRLIKKSLLDYLRIELVKGYHTVRIGRFEH